MNYIKTFYRFIRDIFKNKRLLIDLAKNDFKSRYMGSYLGALWAFIQPMITVFIFWFIFDIGFRSAPVQDFPFILWLMVSMFPWFFISESLSNGTNAILANSFLVKKVVFRVSLLPIVQITSALVIHLFFILILLGMFMLYGQKPTVYWFQIFYYLFCTIILMLGISWATSAIVVFFRDMSQIIGMVIQFGFWLTPVFWSLTQIPEKYRFIIEYNPMNYIIQGYRDSLINNVWFWEKMDATIYYWAVSALFLFGGAIIFRKLRPHFADVL